VHGFGLDQKKHTESYHKDARQIDLQGKKGRFRGEYCRNVTERCKTLRDVSTLEGAERPAYASIIFYFESQLMKFVIQPMFHTFEQSFVIFAKRDLHGIVCNVPSIFE
jgi:hypothetical protein